MNSSSDDSDEEIQETLNKEDSPYNSESEEDEGTDIIQKGIKYAQVRFF